MDSAPNPALEFKFLLLVDIGLFGGPNPCMGSAPEVLHLKLPIKYQNSGATSMMDPTQYLTLRMMLLVIAAFVLFGDQHIQMMSQSPMKLLKPPIASHTNQRVLLNTAVISFALRSNTVGLRGSGSG